MTDSADGAAMGEARSEVAKPRGDGRCVVLIDKPQEWTSHDVVGRMRRLANTRRVGHAGTLDPMATGLLVLGVEQGTRLLTYLVGCDKTYEATIRLGQATITDDAEGEFTTTSGAGEADLGPNRSLLHAAIAKLTGAIEQVPSSVSAIKIDGKRSYARVRGGETVEIPARPVTIHRFEVLDVRSVDADGVSAVDVEVIVECSSGTYIRALARDLGADLGVGGHLTALRRTKVGPFDVADAVTLDALADGGLVAHPEARHSLAAVATELFPRWDVSADETIAIGHGKKLALPEDLATTDGPIAAITPAGELVALLTATGSKAKPLVVFPQA